QGQRLEELVERAEAAGEDAEGLRVLHEHRLAHEEVAELYYERDVLVEPLLEGQLDVAPDRYAPAIARPAVRRLHDPWAAAGDDRVAVPRQLARERARHPVRGVAAAD